LCGTLLCTLGRSVTAGAAARRRVCMVTVFTGSALLLCFVFAFVTSRWISMQLGHDKMSPFVVRTCTVRSCVDACGVHTLPSDSTLACLRGACCVAALLSEDSSTPFHAASVCCAAHTSTSPRSIASSTRAARGQGVCGSHAGVQSAPGRWCWTVHIHAFSTRMARHRDAAFRKAASMDRWGIG